MNSVARVPQDPICVFEGVVAVRVPGPFRKGGVVPRERRAERTHTHTHYPTF